MHPSRSRRVRGFLRRLGIAAAAAACLGAATAPAPAHAAGADPTGLRRIDKRTHLSLRSQGLTSDPATPWLTTYTSQFTIDTASTDSGGDQAFIWGIPVPQFQDGVNHIGDTDAAGGIVLAPLEGGHAGKWFARYDSATLAFRDATLHPLATDEAENNSWDAIAPDGGHFIAGEWGQMRRFEVFRTDALGTGRPFDRIAQIRLDAPVGNIQGCDFASATVLFCASDDATAHKPLLRIDLTAPVGDTDVAGHVNDLGPAPQEPLIPLLAPLCAKGGEVEGVDVSGGVWRVLVVDPCLLWTHEYRYMPSTSAAG